MFMGSEIDHDQRELLMEEGYKSLVEKEKAKLAPPPPPKVVEDKKESESVKVAKQVAELRKEHDELKQGLKNQQTVSTIVNKINSCIKSSDVELDTEYIQRQVMLELNANSNQTVEAVFKAVVDRDKARVQSAVTSYTKKKLETAEKTKTERGSGEVILDKTEPVTSKDLKTGVLKKRLMERLGV